MYHRADEATIRTVSRLNVKFGSAFWAGIARLKIILHFVSHYTIVFCCTTTNGVGLYAILASADFLCLYV